MQTVNTLRKVGAVAGEMNGKFVLIRLYWNDILRAEIFIGFRARII